MTMATRDLRQTLEIQKNTNGPNEANAVFFMGEGRWEGSETSVGA